MKNNYSNWLSYVHKNKYHRWDVRVWINDQLNYFGIYESKDDAVRVATEAEMKFNGIAEIRYVKPICFFS